jgi:hypothetical protein
MSQEKELASSLLDCSLRITVYTVHKANISTDEQRAVGRERIGKGSRQQLQNRLEVIRLCTVEMEARGGRGGLDQVLALRTSHVKRADAALSH